MYFLMAAVVQNAVLQNCMKPKLFWKKKKTQQHAKVH